MAWMAGVSGCWGRISIADDVQPELTRNEYLRLLSAARALGKEQAYLLVKVFANVDLTVQELPQLTVEAVKESRVVISSNSAQRIIYVPATLREELGNYIQCTGILSGPIFVTRSGRQLNRTAVTAAIQGLAHDARVLPEKCNPRCLRKLYQSTMAGIEVSVRLLVEQTHDRLLEQEQLTVGWEAREPPQKRGKRCSISGVILKDEIKGGEENNETKIPIHPDGALSGAVPCCPQRLLPRETIHLNQKSSNRKLAEAVERQPPLLNRTLKFQGGTADDYTVSEDNGVTTVTLTGNIALTQTWTISENDSGNFELSRTYFDSRRRSSCHQK